MAPMRILLGLLLAIPCTWAVDDTAAAAQAVFERSCIKCHGPDKQKGGLRLDSHAAVLKGGKHGPVVIAAKPDKSALIAAVGWADADTRMPPKQKLSDADIAALTAWVEAGAPAPAAAGPKK